MEMLIVSLLEPLVSSRLAIRVEHLVILDIVFVKLS